MAAVSGGVLALISTVEHPALDLSAMDAAAALIGSDASTRPSETLPSSYAPGSMTAELIDVPIDGNLLVTEARRAQAQMLRQRPEQGKAGSQSRIERQRVAAELDRQAAASRRVQAQKTAASTPTSAAASASRCGLPTTGLGPVKSWVRESAEFLGCRFGQPQMYGVASRSGASDHPAGLAVDFMVDKTTGDKLAACALSRAKELGVKYVIWRQRINTGAGWETMEDRGSAAANHMDHVHISFIDAPGSAPTTC